MGKKLYSKEELLNRLQKFASELGRPPTQNEMNDSGPHAAATYADRFGSWNQALKTAGLETGTNSPDGRPPTPEEELLADLESVAGIVEGTPSERDYSTHGEYSMKTYCKRFGGMEFGPPRSWIRAKRRNKPFRRDAHHGPAGVRRGIGPTANDR